MSATLADKLPRLVVDLDAVARDFLAEAAREGRTVRIPLSAPPKDEDLHALEVRTPGHAQPLLLLARPAGPLAPTGYPLRLSLPRAAVDPLVGRHIAHGKLLLEARVGGGGDGTVYRARHRDLHMDVAVKILRPKSEDDTDFVGRFQAEALSASRLDHPNLMRVLDFGQEDDGLLYLAMEYLDGTSVRDIILRGVPLDLDRVTSIMIQVCSGLTHAHARKTVHRDINPRNLMLVKGLDNDGREIELVKVCDFGIAHRIAAGAVAAETAGSPEYMAPEQLLGEEADEQSDVYACGVVLYELLTGDVPVSGDVAEIKVRKEAMDFDAPSHRVPALDARVDEIVLKALARNTYDRYESVRDLRSDLRSIEEHAVVSGGAVAPAPPAPAAAPAAPVAADSLPDWLEAGPGYRASMMPSVPPTMPPPAALSPSMKPPTGSVRPASIAAPSMAPLRPFDAAGLESGDLAAPIAPLLRQLINARSHDEIAALVPSFDPKVRALLAEGQPRPLSLFRATLDAIAVEPHAAGATSRASAVKPLLALFNDPTLLAKTAESALGGGDPTGMSRELIVRAEKAGAYALYGARLRNPDDGARARFVSILQQIGPPALPVIRAGLERLESRLAMASAPTVAEDLLAGIPSFFDDGVSEVVARYTQSDAPGLALAATLALPRVAARRARPILLRLTHHVDDEVALAAIAGLAAFKSTDVAVVEQITTLLRDADPARHAVRLAALHLTAFVTPEAVAHARALCAFVLAAPVVTSPDADDLAFVAASSLLRMGGDRARIMERRAKSSASLRARLDALLTART